MPRPIRTAALILSISLLISLIVTPVAFAEGHEQDEARVKYRQSVMSGIGTHMGAIGSIMKNRLDIPGAIANHAGQMAEAAALIAPAFKKKLTGGPNDAKTNIWEDWTKFEEAAESYETAARGLAAAASGTDPKAVGSAMRKLGKSCGGCHKTFRKPKEESYKNQ